MLLGAPYFAASAIQLLRDSKLGLLVTSNTCSAQTSITFCNTTIVTQLPKLCAVYWVWGV